VARVLPWRALPRARGAQGGPHLGRGGRVNTGRTACSRQRPGVDTGRVPGWLSWRCAAPGFSRPTCSSATPVAARPPPGGGAGRARAGQGPDVVLGGRAPARPGGRRRYARGRRMTQDSGAAPLSATDGGAGLEGCRAPVRGTFPSASSELGGRAASGNSPATRGRAPHRRRGGGRRRDQEAVSLARAARPGDAERNARAERHRAVARRGGADRFRRWGWPPTGWLGGPGWGSLATP
jgi:hypothetical protein